MARVKIINGRQDSDLIGGNFTNSASQTIFNLGSFAVESNFTGRRERDYSNQLSSFSTPVTLETLNLSMDESKNLMDFTSNVKLNLDYSDIKSFARFGSASQILRVTLQNIIDQYPASLYVNNQVDPGGNVTAIDYNYNVQQDLSTFRIPTEFVDNKYGLIYDNGNVSIPDDNTLRNLNLSFDRYIIWDKRNPDEFSRDIIGFTGDSQGVPFITVQVLGEAFPNVTASTVVETTFHLRPKIVEYNKFLSNLSDFERYILSDRSDNNSEINFIIKNPKIGQSGGVEYDDKVFTWTTLDGYNPDIGTGLFNTFSDSLIGIGEKYDEVKSDLVARLLTPDSLRLYDTTQDGKVTSLLRVYGRELDQIKTFIDSLVYINKTSYDKINNIPDRLVKNLATSFGWDTFTITEESDIVNAFFSNEVIQNDDNLLPAEIDIELWRRILINTNYYWKSKGTRNAVKSIFRLIGIPEPFVNITEYVYTVDGKINPDEVDLQLEDIPSASLPYNNQGYPIAPVENNDFFFQISGNTDGGQAYINLYRDLGFNVNRTVDNKKSWIEAGRVDRVHYSTPNYYQEDSRLIINTKEVDATLDIARGIEYDVYCYNKLVDDPITSTGVTRPYIYVNVELDIDNPLEFNLPDTPQSGSSVLMSFNGITLTPLNEIDGQSSGSTEYDYYYDRGNNKVVLNPNIPASASTSRDVISVSYINEVRRGITGYSTVNYVIERPSVFADGAILQLDENPKGDIQLIVDGKTMTKGTSLFTGDFIIDRSVDPYRIKVQNTQLKNYLNNNNNAVRITYIYDDGETNAIKRSEAHRVDSLNSNKFFFNGGVNRNVYIMNYAAFDIESVKITVNGITLTNGKDFTLNPNNKRQVFLPASIKLGDIIGAYYIVDDGSITPPLLPPDDTFPDIQDMSFLEYLELIQRRLINARNRKVVTDNKGGFYPSVRAIYDNYLRRSYLGENDPLKSNGYTIKNLYPFISQYNAFFERFVNQLLPATIILNKSGIAIRNTSFTKQKYRYPRGVNLDTSLQWLGTDGAEYLRAIPVREYRWTDFVCLEEEEAPTTPPPTTPAPTTPAPTTPAPTTPAPTTPPPPEVVRVEAEYADGATRPLNTNNVSDGDAGEFVVRYREGSAQNYDPVTNPINFRVRVDTSNLSNVSALNLINFSEAAALQTFGDGDILWEDSVTSVINLPVVTFDFVLDAQDNSIAASGDLDLVLETDVDGQGNYEETDRISYSLSKIALNFVQLEYRVTSDITFGDITYTLDFIQPNNINYNFIGTAGGGLNTGNVLNNGNFEVEITRATNPSVGNVTINITYTLEGSTVEFTPTNGGGASFFVVGTTFNASPIFSDTFDIPLNAEKLVITVSENDADSGGDNSGGNGGLDGPSRGPVLAGFN